MQIKEISVPFADTVDQEVGNLIGELGLLSVAEMLQTPNSISEIHQAAIRQLLAVVIDLFSTDLPDVHDDPEITLRTVSRDINLARLLRERGLFRLYLASRKRNDDGVLMYMTLINPNTGSPFATQEEFLGWFCQEAKVSRALVFQRMSAIDRLQTIGFSLEDAFRMSVTKPYVIRQTLNQVASWRGGEMQSVNADNVLKLAERLAQDSLPAIAPLVQAAKARPDDEAVQEKLREAAKPVIARLMQEVSEHERAGDAMDWVRHDLLKKPEIRYVWDDSSQALMVEYIPTAVGDDGSEYSGVPIVVPVVFDALHVPQEIVADLLTRLPVRNRPDYALT